MSLKALWDMYGNAPTAVTLILAVGTLVQFSPIKLNPWTRLHKLIKAFLQHIGNACNQEICTNIAELKALIESVNSDTRESIAFMHDKIQIIEQRQAQEYISSKRRAILRFADEIRIGVKHSREMFTNILSDISEYETLCDLSQTPNHVLEEAVKVILDAYHECETNNSYL